MKIFAEQKSLEKLLNPQKLPAYRQIVWGQPEPVKAYPLHEDMEFEDVKIKTIETPGHSLDHVSFLTKDIAFIGDLVVANQNPIIIMREEDYIDLITSLKNLTNLGFKVSYGGHEVWSKSDLINALNNIF